MGQREALLEGSIACLQEKGYAATTARDIVGASGANLSAIGYHYGSKEALLDSALVEAVRRWFEPLIALGAELDPHNLPARTREAVDDFLSALPENRHLAIAYFEALARAERSDMLRTSLAESFHALRTALARNLRQVSPDEPYETSETRASLVCAVFDGLIIQWMIEPSRIPATEDIALSIEAVLTSRPAPAHGTR